MAGPNHVPVWDSGPEAEHFLGGRFHRVAWLMGVGRGRRAALRGCAGGRGLAWMLGVAVLGWHGPGLLGQVAGRPTGTSQPATTRAVLEVRVEPGPRRGWGQAGGSGLLEQAAVLKAEGRWDECVATLESIVARDDNDPAVVAAAQCELVNCYVATGQVDRALAAFRAIREADLEDPRPMLAAGLELARRLEWEGRLLEAVGPLEYIAQHRVADEATRNGARVLLLICYVDTPREVRRPEDAIATAEAVIRDHAAGKADTEQMVRALVWKAKALGHQKQFDEARDLVLASAEAAKNEPVLAYAVEFALGELCRWRGDWAKDTALHEQALVHYRAAFEHARAAGLGEEAEDRARLELGNAMHRLGMRDKGVAWLRMGIDDPARFSPTDRSLAEQIGVLLDSKAGVAWYEYLLEPTNKPDPTAPLVRAEFEAAPSRPSCVTVDSLFDRLYWLGELDGKRGSRQEAVEAYSRALDVASRPIERVRALRGLAYNRWYVRLETGAEPDAEARRVLRELASHAVEVLRNGTILEAQEAMEAAVMGWIDTLRPRQDPPTEALAVAHLMCREAEGTGDPTRIAWAYLTLRRAQGACGHHAEAARTAEALYARFGQSQDARLRYVWGHALLFGAEHYYRVGDMASANRLIAELERRCSDDYFRARAAGYRRARLEGK